MSDRQRLRLVQSYYFNSIEYLTHNPPTGKAQAYTTGIGGVAHAVPL